jgi:hypothetical protein
MLTGIDPERQPTRGDIRDGTQGELRKNAVRMLF